ncbi:DUF3800 domain-containing protein [Falsochrobactrum shanghaiense]|uniref:DUF3800 domain-containing protein n=1 Tax=Falsochrobactrum shanghaiense TaxID=2201899 RepID=A0A316J7D2_9HYPH|nr:DUF3800 domain-containing protein [Falsochrobactrum shanghaiense]PWL17048.1 DUF3800 domain-containing protein [Falsochrobactrum shanghaiense]
MDFGDYVIYVDESGDHSLTSIDENYPIFSLAFCIFRKDEYINTAVPAMQSFKFRWFGHDNVVLHESDIVKRRGPFHFLQYDKIRDRFMNDLSEVMEKTPMTIVSSVIRKENLKRRYANPENPYELGLLFCMEKAHEFIEFHADHERRCHIICESRSPREKAGRGKEDAALELEFRRIVAGDHYLQARNGHRPIPCFDILFASKLANSTGLQIADLIARPIGLRIFKGNQENRAFDIISRKIWSGPKGNSMFHGIKVFP